jgi:hypothetical protein
MGQRCLVHDEEMKYDTRSGFDICRLCEAESSHASGAAAQPDKGEGETTLREAIDRAVGNYCQHGGESLPDGDCPTCKKIVEEVLQNIAVAPSNFKAWFSSVGREVETDPQMSEYKMAEMAWNAGERASFERGRREGIAQTRLDEAKKWCHNWYGYDNLPDFKCECRDCARIAELRAALAAAEAPGKETKP